jgi:solute carrier family 38 (sodium-coupled neutral amino acid transporter), member 11
MAKSKPAAQAAKNEQSTDAEEVQSLLSGSSDDSDLVVLPRPSPLGSPDPLPLSALQPRRQSSFAQPRPDGAPRTPNRVQFDDAPIIRTLTPRNSSAWIEEEDFLGRDSASRDGRTQRVPLLTDMEAPSVTVASADIGFNAEDLLESARPKSGMQSAFMNMANSIMSVDL